MNIDENTLLAFVDGELNAEESAVVAAAIAKDAELARRVDAERALRARLNDAFAGQLNEPVPDRLLRTVREHADTSKATVLDLQAARDARTKQASTRPAAPLSRRLVGSMAASVVGGLFLGYFVGRDSGTSFVRSQAGQLVASGNLAAALTAQLSSEAAANAPVQIGFTYRSKSGDYCRTFQVSSGPKNSGVACRRGDAWQVDLLTHDETTESASEFRTAATSTSPLVLQKVQQQITGDPLDRTAESAARLRSWRNEQP